jgi:hypothetical protein
MTELGKNQIQIWGEDRIVVAATFGVDGGHFLYAGRRINLEKTLAIGVGMSINRLDMPDTDTLSHVSHSLWLSSMIVSFLTVLAVLRQHRASGAQRAEPKTVEADAAGNCIRG